MAAGGDAGVYLVLNHVVDSPLDYLTTDVYALGSAVFLFGGLPLIVSRLLKGFGDMSLEELAEMECQTPKKVKH